jgi:hypothetical protein
MADVATLPQPRRLDQPPAKRRYSRQVVQIAVAVAGAGPDMNTIYSCR